MNCCDYDCTQGRNCPARQKPTPGAPNAWEPSGKDHDRSIHSNPDAKAWADLFVDTFPGLADKRDLMLGWFANAMMAMHDSIKQKQAPPADELQRLRGENAVMVGLLGQCAEVLCTVEPESDTEGEELYALLHAIQGVIEPKAKGALL